MPLNKILVVYNTCGIKPNENSESYINSLNSILDQDTDKFDVVMSSCLNNDYTRQEVKSFFGNRIKYNFINEVHPVNVTFNHSVDTVVKYNDEYKGLYVCRFGKFFFILIKMLSLPFREYLDTNKYGMITPQPSNDTEYFAGLGFGKYEEDNDVATRKNF